MNQHQQEKIDGITSAEPKMEWVRPELGRPARATLTPWALLFRGAGHQQPHHHPGCWMTGVYYVSARCDVPRPDSPGPGVIRIGRLPAWAGVEPPWPVLDIEPTPGTLLLFPSYVPHETLPPGDEAERISVAFDVAAADRCA